MSTEQELTPRQKAYALALPFTQSKIFRTSNGDLLMDILDSIEEQLRAGLGHTGQRLLTDYLYYLNSLHEFECEYEFYSGWDACKKHYDY